MALRIRKNGQILCAAMHDAEPGDTYLDDHIHGELTGSGGTKPVIGTEPIEKHKKHGQWWWLGNVPTEIQIESFYIKQKGVR